MTKFKTKISGIKNSIHLRNIISIYISIGNFENLFNSEYIALSSYLSTIRFYDIPVTALFNLSEEDIIFNISRNRIFD